MSGSNLFQLRHLCLTSVCAILAAVLERAALWYIQRTWCFTLDTLDLLAGIHMNGELCTQKCLCIWMHCILCNIFTWNNLYDISQIHNSNLMGKRADQRQVMADEKHADIFFFLKAYQKLDHRLLHRNIQRRSRLIANQDLRFQ